MLHHNIICLMIIESNNGRVIKELGDGMMVRFEDVGTAVTCAVQVTRCLREHVGRMRTRASVACGTLWDVKNSRGDQDVYGPPVHMSQRMSEHAIEDTILIEGREKEIVVGWLEGSKLVVKLSRSKIRDYPRIRMYRIFV